MEKIIWLVCILCKLSW